MVRVVKQVILFLAFFSVTLCLCGHRLQAQNTTDATKNYHDLNPGMQVSFSKQVAPIFQAKCVTCHSNHEIHKPTDALVGTGPGTVCSQCHAPGDECDKQSVRIRQAIGKFASTLDEARDLLEEAEKRGMEVSEAIYSLKKEGVSGLVETRALIHSFDTERLAKRAEEGMAVATSARESGHAALAELQFRRKGLAASLAFIGLVLTGLYLKIRQVDRDSRAL